MKPGEIIGKLAREKNINLHQLAIKSDVPYNTLYAMVKRKSERIEPGTLQRIADALEVPVWELMDYDINTNTQDLNLQEKNDLLRILQSKGRLSKEEWQRLAELLRKMGYKMPPPTARSDNFNISFASEDGRISYFYSQLNTDGQLAASEHFRQHLDKESIKEVADYVENLFMTPQYQRYRYPDAPSPAPEGTDTTPAAKPTEGPQEGE